MAFNKWISSITGITDENDSDTEVNNGNSYDYVTEGKYTNKMLLLEPRAYSESQQIADYLKGNSSVIVNLKRVTPEQAKRIVDFLSGTLYAIEGDLQKLGGGIFLCTPKTVAVEGTISDDVSKSKTKKDDDEDFNW